MFMFDHSLANARVSVPRTFVAEARLSAARSPSHDLPAGRQPRRLPAAGSAGPAGGRPCAGDAWQIHSPISSPASSADAGLFLFPKVSSVCRAGPRLALEVPLAVQVVVRQTRPNQRIPWPRHFIRNKPHVNVGTIGHIDHGKTTLTAAILRCSAAGPGRVQDLRGDRQGRHRARRDKTVTIIAGHVAVRDRAAALRPHRLPRPRRLHQEHDHRRGPDGRRRAAALGGRRPDAADPRAHPAGPPGRRAASWWCSSTSATWWTDGELIDLVELEMRELLTQYGFDGRRSAGRPRQRQAAHDQPADPAAQPLHRRAAGGAGSTYMPEPVRDVDRPFLMPIEGVYSIEGRGTVVTGKIERGSSAPATRWRSSAWATSRWRRVCTSVEAFNRLLDRRPGRRERRLPAARRAARTGRARPGDRGARHARAADAVRG